MEAAAAVGVVVDPVVVIVVSDIDAFECCATVSFSLRNILCVRKRPLQIFRPVGLSPCKFSRTTGRMLIKFDIGPIVLIIVTTF
jgi:hypothetical protein